MKIVFFGTPDFSSQILKKILNGNEIVSIVTVEDSQKGRGKKFQFPDHYPLIEKKTKRYPFKLITAPAHNFLNTSFTETISSLKIERKPTLKVHPDDMIKLKISEDEMVEIGSKRGSIKIHIEKFPGVMRSVTICEGIWPNEYFIGNLGVNALVGADRPEPAGGGVFHDVAIWIKKISS